MLVAHLNGDRVLAELAHKGPIYHCPGCGLEVTLKKGMKVTHHFSHKPPVTCPWARGETVAHLKAKMLFLNHLRAISCTAEVEYPIGTQRADVYAKETTGETLVFEMQHQPITEQEIARRTQAYYGQGASVTWLPLISLEKIEKKKRTAGGFIIERYSPKPFERWLDSFHFKDIWYLDPGTGFMWNGSFSPVMLEKPYSEWYETGGGHQSAGGYAYRSKRYLQLTLTGPFTLGQLDIRTKYRRAASFGNYVFPQGRRVVFQPRLPTAQPTL